MGQALAMPLKRLNQMTATDRDSRPQEAVKRVLMLRLTIAV